jgi:acyl-CoA synthetase (AMP-forming)/AMP-acid ligase II
MIRPFDQSRITRGADNIARYDGRAGSLITMLRATVDRTPTNEAVVELGGGRVNYRELWDRAARVSGGLKNQGIQRGDRVAIRLGNSLDWCVAFWGTLMSGAIVVPVNTRFSEPEVEYVIADSGSRFVFLPDQPLPSGDPFVVEGLTQPDVAAIFYTSGTTGFPKGAMTTHEGFLSNTETCRRIVPLPSDGSVRTLVSVPLFHVTGCNSQLLTSCESGGGSIIMRAFEVQAFLRAIVEERITSVTSVPAVFWLAINQTNFGEFDMRGVRWAMYGGAPIAPDLVGRIVQAFPNARVGNGFGLTETSSVATFLPHEYSGVRPDSVGFAAPVVDLDLFEVDSGGVGELLVRGPNVVKGYWNKPEATANTFVNDWLHTGDLARIDADGFVQIVDRKKDMVNRGGENVYCVEVENALCAHPAVYECAVMGVPDTMMGEKVGAVIVLKPGAKAEPAEIREFLKGRLADFKIPQFMTIRPDPLPRNPGGKILKPRLRKETEWGSSLR